MSFRCALTFNNSILWDAFFVRLSWKEKIKNIWINPNSDSRMKNSQLE